MKRLAFALAMTAALGGIAQSAEQNLSDLDLATLMNMDVTVTSAARREEAASDTAAAVYVIGRDEIRRSGATSIPEVLGLAPGLEVARIDSRAWAVSSRGFNSRFASKLLVMVDGRSIYTPLFSGVIWEEQTVPLDQSERIEIVRGPGGALWGINAVNGVINIITRKAANSEGLHAHAEGGTDEQAAALSYGGHTSLTGDYRVYVEHAKLDSLATTDRTIERTQGGFRIDRTLADGSLTLQGDYGVHDFGDAAPWPAGHMHSASDIGNVFAAWKRAVKRGVWEIRSFYNWANRSNPDNWDDASAGVESQFSAERIGRHLLAAGIGYRYLVDEIKDPNRAISLDPARLEQNQWSVYGQDQIHFFNDDVRITVGAKLDDLKYTGLAFQPTLRGLWRINDAQTLWAAASRAVRTPSRAELHSQMVYGSNTPDGLLLFRMNGNPRLDAEKMHAYELGWRWRPYQQLSFDFAAYRNEYRHLIGAEPLNEGFEFMPEPAYVATARFANVETARVEGLEIVAEYMPVAWMHLNAQANFIDNTVISELLTDPKHSYSFRAQFDMPKQLQFDLAWRAVGQITGYFVPSYDVVGARLAWNGLPNVEFAVHVDNLLDHKHIEFADEMAFGPGATIGRSFVFRATWQPRN
jgi:iron complex outermembrane receptor protein